MAVNDGTLSGWPFVNFGMSSRGTQTSTGPGRVSIVYPRRKFTFLVEFFINPRALDAARAQTNLKQHIQDGRLLATLRSIDHPKVNMTVEKLRSYNKTVLLPTKTEYQPATMTFHDDNTSIASALWREYRAYYQGEGTLGQTAVRSGGVTQSGLQEFRTGTGMIGDAVRTEMETRPSLGMTIKANDGRHYFDAIRIYDLGSDPDSVNVYTFLYPVITVYDHDALDYEDRAGQVGISMTFEYEGYYHLIGLNNAPFHDVIEQQLGFRPITVASNAPGHAKMIATPASSTIPVGGLFSPILGSLGGIVDTPSSPSSPGVGAGVSFDDDIATPGSLTPPPVTSSPLGTSGGLSNVEINDIIARTRRQSR